MRRVLIDECINPRLAGRLRAAVPEVSFVTVREIQAAGFKDHHLIRLINGAFEVFVTIDKGFAFEHNVRKLCFGIIIVSVYNNQMPSYERLLTDLSRQIAEVDRGEITHLIDPALLVP